MLEKLKKLFERSETRKPQPPDSFQQIVREGYQRFDDTCAEIPRHCPRPYFVKVGANDGLAGDPCSQMLLDNKAWEGMLIEPVPYLFEKLGENFSDRSRFRLVQAAIGTQQSLTRFFYVDPAVESSGIDVPEWYDRIGGFNRNHLIKHLGTEVEPFIQELELPVTPLGALVAEIGIPSIELLHIDVEGFDFKVLQSHDFSTHPPLVILVEQKHLSEDDRAAMLAFLDDHRYHTFPFGGEVFALRQDAPQSLLQRGRFAA